MTPPDPPHPSTPPSAPAAPGKTATSGESASQNARIIKRYSNRKLYDTVESRYVTLPQIAELVRNGEEVRIIDNNTKEDLTSVTLAQILYEEERKQSRALPLAALKDLIHTSGEKLFSTLREGPVGKFIGKAPGESQTTDAKSAPPPEPAQPVTGDAGSPGRLAEFYEQSRGSLQEWQHRVDERVRKVLETISPSAQLEKLQAEVRKIAQRLEEIEARLGSSRGGGGKDADSGKPRE